MQENMDSGSAERDMLAEMCVLEVLNAEGVTFTEPISRAGLGMVARKRIRDNGLLDNFLKQVGGKTAPAGTDTIWLNLIAGGIAGAVSLTATAPLDRLKVVLQVQTKPAAAVHVFSKIWREDRLLGFFRGNGLHSATVVPKVVLQVCAYEMLKPLIRDIETEKGDIDNSGRIVVGGLAGAMAQTAFYPFDFIKTRLQTWPSQSGQCPKLGTLTKNIWNHEGPRAFYRGLVPSLLPIFPCVGIYLATYRALEDMSERRILHDEAGPVAQRACQILSGALGSMCLYPLQVICTRLQARPSNVSNSYKGMSNVLASTLKREGFRGLYKGFLSYLLVLWPAASITFVVYGTMKNSLGLSSKGCLLCRTSETNSLNDNLPSKGFGGRISGSKFSL